MPTCSTFTCLQRSSGVCVWVCCPRPGRRAAAGRAHVRTGRCDTSEGQRAVARVCKGHGQVKAALTRMCATLLFILCVTPSSLSSSLPLSSPSEPSDPGDRPGAASRSACSSSRLSGEGLRRSLAARQAERDAALPHRTVEMSRDQKTLSPFLNNSSQVTCLAHFLRTFTLFFNQQRLKRWGEKNPDDEEGVSSALNLFGPRLWAGLKLQVLSARFHTPP